MMEDDEFKQVETHDNIENSRSYQGAYGGPPGGNEGPSKNSIAPKSYQKSNFQNCSKSLQNDPLDIVRQGSLFYFQQ